MTKMASYSVSDKNFKFTSLMVVKCTSAFVRDHLSRVPIDDACLEIEIISGYGLEFGTLPADFVRLDQDILTPLAGKKKLFTHETLDFWEQIKTPGMSLRCSALYLSQYRCASPDILAKGDGVANATIVGDVYIHPSAKVHSTAKIGPNVSISANARIGAGKCRCNAFNCWLEVINRKVVKSSGKKLILGEGNYTSKLGITILGEGVTVDDEVVVINCIVLPHKTLNFSVQEEIIL
eukprot:Gb_12674 [translate_table: standard]